MQLANGVLEAGTASWGGWGGKPIGALLTDSDPALEVARLGQTALDAAIEASVPDGGVGEATVTGGRGTVTLDRSQGKRRPKKVPA